MKETEKIIILLKRYSYIDDEVNDINYQCFLDFVTPLSMRYTNDFKEQSEMIKLCFRKAVMYFHQFKIQGTNQEVEFQRWLKKMMLYACVEYFRNNFKLLCFLKMDNLELGRIIQSASRNFKLSNHQLENILLQLPPSHRLVISLRALYGLCVEEIAQCLNITSQKTHFILIEATSRLEVMLSSSEADYA